jgi:1,4-dihydroxy-2-naphthoate octaprenyltransferase
VVTGGTQRAAAPRSLRARLTPYFWLAKFDVRGYLMTVPVAATALEPSLLGDGIWALLVLLPLELCVFGIVVTLDDVQGARDGSDAINYGERGTPRTQRRKPILAGLVTPEQALAFARVLGLIGAVLLVAAWLASPRDPDWFVPAYLLLAVTAAQYSYGIRWSYRFPGGAEFIQGGSTAAGLILAYYLVAASVPSMVIVEALLVGIWHIQIGTSANAHDRDGDRQAGRRTVAVTISDRAYRVFVAGVFVTGWALLIAATVAGWVPVAVPIMAAPAVYLQVGALKLGPLRGDWLNARKQGFRSVYAGATGLVLANVLAVWLSISPFSDRLF